VTLETAADAFLNWVRGAFADAPGESNAVKWRNFFDGNSASGVPNNMGMWLRNAGVSQLVRHPGKDTAR
jgi:hypothetical protein